MMIRANASGVLYPADRCTWTHSYDSTTQQYDIDTVTFYGVDSTIDVGSNATLGYIGKSGRFVPISES